MPLITCSLQSAYMIQRLLFAQESSLFNGLFYVIIFFIFETKRHNSKMEGLHTVARTVT